MNFIVLVLRQWRVVSMLAMFVCAAISCMMWRHYQRQAETLAEQVTTEKSSRENTEASILFYAKQIRQLEIGYAQDRRHAESLAKPLLVQDIGSLDVDRINIEFQRMLDVFACASDPDCVSSTTEAGTNAP